MLPWFIIFCVYLVMIASAIGVGVWWEGNNG